MIDRTQEDINQDVRIASLEQKVREIKTQLDGAGRRLADHELQLHNLDPLRGLIEHVEAIKSFFENLASKISKSW